MSACAVGVILWFFSGWVIDMSGAQRELMEGVIALLAVGVPLLSEGTGFARGFGFMGLVLASVNIFGGFLVTSRMLAMYKKKEGAK